MTENEKIAYAKTFIDKMADGINPLDDTPVPDEGLLNNIRINRCLHFVSDVLRRHLEAERSKVPAPPTKTKKLPLRLTREIMENEIISEMPIPISEITRRINCAASPRNMRGLRSLDLSRWLRSIGAIAYQKGRHKKRKKEPTEKGVELGIKFEKMICDSGVTNDLIVYSADAQRMIVEHFAAIPPLGENDTGIN